MTNPIRPGWLSWIYRTRWKPAKPPLPKNPSNRTDVFLSAAVSAVTHHHEKSRLIHGLLGLHFETQGYPVENELDILIPPLTIQLLHSRTTFSGDLHTSLLQQTGPRVMAKYFIPDLPPDSWTFRSTFLDPGFYRCIRIRRINSASDNSTTSFLDNL